ncbi:MAG: N-6 DNA methylase [Polaromonas sp.]|uniref:HsdM family class I SAM-dependent methyltransferase n=1 Tax=Polaromonas sp. TaxID=1869339 RepID=UPI002736E694|nr:N-6 DNA methylase [Polaromonas sp.]MDP2819850.1 N-6 DNA methylase [Polaromonas sp.]
MKSITAELLKYGIPAEAVVEFGATPTPRQVRYLDLFRKTDDSEAGTLPTGVIESAARPAVYFKRSGGLGAASLETAELQDLIRTLACRADARYLALISPGVVTVYKIGFFGSAEVNQLIFQTTPGSFRLRNLISGLDLASLDAVGNSDKQWLEGHLFNLLKGAASEIRSAAPEQLLSNGDVISLIGRALFTRFLVDRDILKDSELGNVAQGAQDARQLFDAPHAASSTFHWLDRIFNGDLLHLSSTDYANFFDGLGDKATMVCRTLGNIMRRAPGGQLPLDWGGLRFKHIPVDVLSQVYEHFAHENFPELAKKTSVHYTPRGIAELVVDGTFTALPADKIADATVLDAAAGAGVFLVLAFRRLVGELWFRQNHRPDRRQIRKILNTQLCGMDINPESLKMAALSLYLAALELDPDPQPLSDLKFDELFDTVLHCVEEERLQGDDAHLGSLATGIPDIGQFDIVLGNPPWTVFPGSDKKFLDAVAAKAVQPLLSKEALKRVTSLVPRQAPDLAFLWKSLQWCKPGGAIGYLLDARLLFNADHFEARRLLFTELRVTGILNATALRKEKRVWPSHDKPFCALVAINTKPQLTDSFYYLSPHVEVASKALGVIRLDPSAATPVPNTIVRSHSFALKALFKGSALDLNLLERLADSPRLAFGEYVKKNLGSSIHRGYQPTGAVQKSASHLADLPSLETSDAPKFEVQTARLMKVRDRYPELHLHMPYSRETYKGPSVLFRQAPKFDREMRGAIWSKEDVAFCFSYYGLPVGQNPIGQYLFVLSYSDLFVYWALLTSAKFGIERETFYLEDIRSFPIAPYSELSEALREKCQKLADQIRAGESPWVELEVFVKAVYRLSDLDWQLIKDALTFGLPYSQSLKLAAAPTNARAGGIFDFVEEVQISLNELIDDSFVACVVPVPSLNEWLFFKISKAKKSSTEASLDLIMLASQIACEKSFWTTQLRLQMAPEQWLVGQPSQARYWSKSKARLLALQLSESGLFSSASAN